MKKTKEDIVLGTIKYICIAALLIVVLFPIIWLVAGSFKLEKEIFILPAYRIRRAFQHEILPAHF